MQQLRMQLLRPQPHSALDCYQPCERFSGWDASDSQAQEDTYKQLCTNLSKYERQYNETKQTINRSYHFKGINRSWQDKENQVKFPVVIQSTPLKLIKKSPFALKSRNFLQDSIDNDQDSKAKCFRIAKIIKVKKSSLFSEQKPKEPLLVAYKRKKHNKLITNPMIDYDFSDSRILSRHKKEKSSGQSRQ